jgi:hypothetical protein
MNLFDVYGRNAYDYKEGANFTHGYASAQRTLTETLGQGKPALLTEFGRSVSRRGGSYYGGNTLQEQADAMIRYYRDILDSGSTGLCPFYYADGWWKTGDSSIHSDEAEAWFGFFGYRDLKDTVGYPRPAWHALKQYNRTLLTSPKNQQFYLNEVPVEAFCRPDVKKLRVVYEDGIRLELKPDVWGHCIGNLSFAGEELRDRELVFESYDAKGRLLKIENIVLLTGKAPVLWPTLELRTPVSDLSSVQAVPIEITVRNGSIFSLGNEVRYAFSHHLGWNRAEVHSPKIDPQQKELALSASYQVPAGCPMLAIYAGIDIRFGKFVKTLGAHQYLYPGIWANPLRVKTIPSQESQR